MIELSPIYKERYVYSQTRLNELKQRISRIAVIPGFAHLTIFGAGSYARHEACEHSDIDMFFLCQDRLEELPEPHTGELRLFGKLIEIIDDMRFPKFSNDCQYLKIQHSPQILQHIGSPMDDNENYFTVRMLLLLESKCLYGDETYDNIIKEIISSYFKDYPDHEQTFQPIFLLNDICRFWKTLLMNYEHKRLGSNPTEIEKTKQKVRNFKLKFSRMTTCYATIASICSYDIPITEKQVIEQTRLTPRERLESIPERIPEAEEAVREVLDRYVFFLKNTGLTTEDLNNRFTDKSMRTDMFKIANEYGDSMFELIRIIDNHHDDRFKFLRYLVI